MTNRVNYKAQLILQNNSLLDNPGYEQHISPLCTVHDIISGRLPLSLFHYVAPAISSGENSRQQAQIQGIVCVFKLINESEGYYILIINFTM